MAEGINRVTLLGNLGADAELRYTQGGQPVLNLRIATTEVYFDANKERKERTDWHQVTVWGKRGEALAKFLAKGSQILVEGRIQTSGYEKAGEKRYKTEIVASNVVLCGRREGGERGASSEAPRGRAASAPAPADDYPSSYGGGSEGSDDLPFAPYDVPQV